MLCDSIGVLSIYMFCVPGDGDGGEKKNKKRVSWASDDNLTMIQYFELDESERGNVTCMCRVFVCMCMCM